MTLTKADRAEVVCFNVKHNGLYDGSGYPGHSPNVACKYFHIGTTFACAIGNSFAFAKTDHPLISMQSGWHTGYAYCPYGLDTARKHHAVIGSWQTEPADLLFIHTGSGAQPGHTEMVIFRNSGAKLKRQLEQILGIKLIADDEVMYSFGWDSGPSNVDHYRGQGGCHVHMWRVPKGVGHPSIMAAADAAALVAGTEHETASKKPKRSAVRKAAKHGPKGTPLAKDTESKVTVVRTRLLHRKKRLAGPDRKRLRKLRSAINNVLHRK
jgi:hypothetical protein